MSRKEEKILEAINELTPEELRELFGRITDHIELNSFLKLAEPTFSDWDNEEDAVYEKDLEEGYAVYEEINRKDAELFFEAQAEVVLRKSEE
ncbi:MAG: hypothetical protein AB1510_04615 [Bacillota bacterium]